MALRNWALNKLFNFPKLKINISLLKAGPLILHLHPYFSSYRILDRWTITKFMDEFASSKRSFPAYIYFTFNSPVDTAILNVWASTLLHEVWARSDDLEVLGRLAGWTGLLQKYQFSTMRYENVWFEECDWFIRVLIECSYFGNIRNVVVIVHYLNVVHVTK